MKKSPGYGTQNFDSCEKNFNFLTIFKINVVPKNRDVKYLKKYKPQVPKLFAQKNVKNIPTKEKSFLHHSAFFIHKRVMPHQKFSAPWTT